MPDAFWAVIDAQLAALRSAATADDVIEILNTNCTPPSHAEAFFGGSGGDIGVDEALSEAGWRYVWSKANYHWAMSSPVDGSVITYVEGDIYTGDPVDQR